ncbi:SRPBCC family protein [Nocardia mexicana]|uniref:Polyketide cyclase/dehydrase/lipid transport protein n=1 Tax=Nocardia mexicana TaxID=279262 RepID=A0A370GRR7_9NOCA|nr:SRPBCC family protein [Nocardia mexicana]RDI46402.1 polyketide cyclase/dehydrase/lipid transport protein [Nocardia mexicana]
MRTVMVAVSADIAAPPPKVWEQVVDWERPRDWVLEAAEFQVVSTQHTGVGVIVEATVGVGCVRTGDRFRTDVWQPPDGSGSGHLGLAHLGWVEGRGDIHLTSLPDGRTRLTWRERLQPPLGWVGEFGLRLVSPLLAWTCRRELAHLRASVEA